MDPSLRHRLTLGEQHQRREFARTEAVLLGRTDKARTAWERSLALPPGNHMARVYLRLLDGRECASSSQSTTTLDDGDDVEFRLFEDTAP